MTEHGRTHVQRTSDTFQVGASHVSWQSDTLDISIDDYCAPLPFPARGRIRVRPHFAPRMSFALDAGQRHWWAPISPRCDVEVTFEQPGLSWRGAGYLDSNVGDEPLERGFSHWDWARAHDENGCVVTYRTTPRSGDPIDTALYIDDTGGISARPLPALQRLPSTIWGIDRRTRADQAHVVRTLEDAPFYARSELVGGLYGHHGPIMHESLDLTRFASAWVKALLPFRMPRKA